VQRERPIIDLWMVNIADDRGAVRRCQMFGTLFGERSYEAELTRVERDRMRTAASALFQKHGAMLGVGFGLSFVAARVAFGKYYTSFWIETVALFAMIPVVWLVWDFTIMQHRLRPAYAAERKRIAMEIGRCAWCLYPLPSGTMEDGMVVCPECGGAWKR